MPDEFDSDLNKTLRRSKTKFWQRSSRKKNSTDESLDLSITKSTKRKRITEFASNVLSSSTAGNRLSSVTVKSLVGAETLVDDDSTPSKRRKSEYAGSLNVQSWINDVAQVSEAVSNLSKTEVKRQEAIYELYCGETTLVNDLQELKELYLEPLESTDIFTQAEMQVIFCDLPALLQVHEKLRDNLAKLRDSVGYTECIGTTILEWLPSLTKPYLDRCKTQIHARHLLERKKLQSKKFQEFLKHKTGSRQSVELWTYLDVARSRIVKYPLLINEILRRTPTSHEDHSTLKSASEKFTELLQQINQVMGDAECDLARSKINIKTENDSEGCIQAARELITEGPLRASRGFKLHGFLFNTCLALTRPAIKSRCKVYNLTYPIVPTNQLTIDTNTDSACEFKIANRLFLVQDEHDKRHWLNALEKARRIDTNK